MSNLRNLTVEQVAQLMPQASDIERAGAGGQAAVFKGTIAGKQYALKFAKVPVIEDLEGEEWPMDDVEARAQREVETMRDCASEHMVKLGPIGVTFDTIDGQSLLYFSEEFIAGRDLRTILQADGKFEPSEVIKLGLHIVDAIHALWDLGKIHRDIKPANIMRREHSNEYVLLDAGFAFDVIGESLSIGPVGTPPYFSPEQFDFTNRRAVLDFRSDLFSLGVTMYEMATGQHPFWTRGESSASLFDKITTLNPALPSEVCPGFPEQLSDIVMRMIAKSPHLRYRRCQQLLNVLNEI